MEPVADPLQYFTDTYDSNVAKPIIPAHNNFIYIRGKNLSDTEQAGVAYVYWARVSDLERPSKWKNNVIRTSEGAPYLDLSPASPGSIVVGGVGFLWTPPTETTATEYALIGVIATNDHPNPVPGLRDTNFNYDKWVANQGGVGTWLVTVEPPPPPTATFGTSGNYDLKNPAGVVEFYIKTTGIPVGSQVSFKAAKPDSSGNSIDIPLTTVNQDPFKTGTQATLDANWQSAITFEVYLKDGSLPLATNSVTVYAGIYEPPITSKSTAQKRVNAEGDGPSKFIILGQYTTVINVPVQQ